MLENLPESFICLKLQPAARTGVIFGPKCEKKNPKNVIHKLLKFLDDQKLFEQYILEE